MSEARALPCRVYVGLGSNLDAPRRQVLRAFDALAGLKQATLVDRSSLYRSAPMGPADQPDFINAVAALDVRLSPEALLDGLQEIENAQGRVRKGKWGPRTLDLDILVFGGEMISTPRLTVPHPGLPERAFVLYPLAELAPGLVVPGAGRVDELAARVDRGGIERLQATSNKAEHP